MAVEREVFIKCCRHFLRLYSADNKWNKYGHWVKWCWQGKTLLVEDIVPVFIFHHKAYMKLKGIYTGPLLWNYGTPSFQQDALSVTALCKSLPNWHFFFFSLDIYTSIFHTIWGMWHQNWQNQLKNFTVKSHKEAKSYSDN